MKRTILVFGLISGAVMSAMMLVTMPLVDRIGTDVGEIIGYTTMVAAFLLIYFGVRSYRDEVSAGRISFGRALTVGLLITAVASACYVATWEVIYYKLAPDFPAKYAAKAIERAKADGASPAEIEKRRAEMQRLLVLYNNPLYNSAITFLEPLPVGVTIALLTAVVLGRKPKQARADAGGLAVEA